MSDRQWVRITDRMPEVYEPVWLGGGGGVVVQGHADGERWRTEAFDDRYARCPWTHWMPREPEPDPPEEGA